MREFILVCIMVLSQFSLFSSNAKIKHLVLQDTLKTERNSQVLKNNQPTNVIFIMADNLGAWSLGCYGNPDIQTPNLDRLAKDGIIFRRAMSSNPVCSPTRATFFTGLVPSQHGVHTYIDNKYMMGPEAKNTVSELNTLPETLEEAGYVCGLSGKWHLGDHLEPAKGFSYWVCKPGGHTTGFYNQDVIEDGKVHKVSEYMTDYWTKRGIEFIEKNMEDDSKPFFLALTYNGPYGLSDLMLRQASNRWGAYYKNKHFKSFVSDRMHPWQNGNKSFHNKQIAMERYAAELSGLDDGIGEIMKTLERHGLDSNTLVVFTADQGWMGGQNGIWGMGDHTVPKGANDIMMRIPMIFHHPGKISSGGESDIMVSNYDFMPTLLKYLGIEQKMSGNKPESPGRDFSPILTNSGEDFVWENVMYYEMEDTRAIRTDNWKYVARYPDGPYEIYNLKIDPQERFNMYGQPNSVEKTNELSAQLDKFYTEYANPKYDLWKGGVSKVHRITSDTLKYTKNYFITK